MLWIAFIFGGDKVDIVGQVEQKCESEKTTCQSKHHSLLTSTAAALVLANIHFADKQAAALC